MVFTINSSIGQDAVILGKPVICLGDVNYEILPTVLRLRTFQNMGEKVENYIKCFKSSEKLVIRYLATLIHQSSPVNLYSTILQKQGVFSNDKLDYDTEIKKLANLLKKCIETKEF